MTESLTGTWSRACHSAITLPVGMSISWKMLSIATPLLGPPTLLRFHRIGWYAVTSAVLSGVSVKSCMSAW